MMTIACNLPTKFSNILTNSTKNPQKFLLLIVTCKQFGATKAPKVKETIIKKINFKREGYECSE